MQVVGFIKLPVGMYCDIDCLQSYEANIAGIQIKIHFPQYIKPEKQSLEMGSLIAPDIAKEIRENNEELDWGRVDYRSLETTGAEVQIIAVECKEDDAQPLYETFNPWLERFQAYCFLCNKQFFHVVDTTSSGGNRLALVGKGGYIHPEKPQTASMTFQLAGGEAYLKSEHIQKAIEYASSGKHIRPEYEFMQQAYEAEEKHLHRLSIVNACSALEMCLMKQIDEKLAILPEDQIPEGKRRYLDQLVEYMGKLDAGFRSMEQDIKTEVVEVRNDILHQNRNPYPTRKMAYDAINRVDIVLRYFFDDFAE